MLSIDLSLGKQNSV